jgi:hypothetical protein
MQRIAARVSDLDCMERGRMSSLLRVSGLVLAAGAALLIITGCETSHTNKMHPDVTSISDETTTGKQDPAFIADGKGQPPVPGSPTAAGADGKQPYNDMDARAGKGSEEGIAPPPAEQAKDSFQRQ